LESEVVGDCFLHLIDISFGDDQDGGSGERGSWLVRAKALHTINQLGFDFCCDFYL